jgi:hypothetical protein
MIFRQRGDGWRRIRGRSWTRSGRRARQLAWGLEALELRRLLAFNPITYGSFLAGDSRLDLNGNAAVVNNALQLTDGGTSEASSAFYGVRLNAANFTTDFQFQLTNAVADGFAFVIQGNSATALGLGGGNLGYTGINHSVAVKFDLYNDAGEGDDSTGLYTNGATPTVPATDLSSLGINLHSGDVMAVHMTYDGQTLTVQLTDTQAQASATQTYNNLNIPSLLGAATGYFGFTGASGSFGAVQDILSWSVSTNVLPSPWVDTDIGAPGVAGSTQFLGLSGNVDVPSFQYTVAGSGAGVSGTSDQFHFLEQTITGDGSVVAQLDSFNGGASEAEAGIMFRPNNSAGSPFTALMLTPTGQVVFQTRAPGGTATVTQATVTAPSPTWLELQRSGNTFTASVSSDGVNWSVVGSKTVGLGGRVLTGLAVTSADNSSLATAVFSNVVVNSDSVPLGAEPSALSEGSPQFVDVMKQAGPFLTAAKASVPATLDANGWPTEDFQTTVLTAGPNTVGTYQLSAVCAQDPMISFTGGAMVQNQTYDPTTGLVTADVVISNPNFTTITMTFTNTGGGATDIKLYQPGYALSSTQIVTTPVLNLLERSDTIRFMSWQDTPLDPTVDWAERAQVTDARYDGPQGVPYEILIELANQLHKNLWICVPEQASDDYITQLANLIKNGDTVDGVTYPGLDPSLDVYIEHGNEVWNNIYPENGWALAAAQAYLTSGASPNLEDQGPIPNSELALRYHDMRTVQISQIFASVFGTSAINTRIRPVLGLQLGGDTTGIALANLDWVARNYPGGPSAYLYGVAVNAYIKPVEAGFIDSMETRTNTTPQEWLNEWQAGVNSYRSPTGADHINVTNVAALATNFGLKLMAYEGGLRITIKGSQMDDQAKATLADALSSPQLATMVRQFLDAWYSLGGSLINWFTASAGPVTSFSVTTDLNNQATPKLQGIDAVRAAAQPQVTAGVLAPAEIDARAYLQHSQAVPTPYQTPYLENIAQNASFLYLVRVPAAGTYQVVVTGGADPSQTDRDLIISVNNSAPQTVQVPVTAPGGDLPFAATNPVSFSFQAGLNTIRLIVPASDPYNLNSIEVLTADGTGVPHTMPTMGGFAFGPNPTIAENSSFSGTFEIGDAVTPLDQLVVQATSSNPKLVPVPNIALSGQGQQWSFTVTPTANQYGAAWITITVTNAAGLSRSTSFHLIVSPPQPDLAFGRPTEASGESNAMTVKAFAATDGNPTTGWTSPPVAGHWLYVDLGQDYNINEVKLTWGASYATAFEIQVTDGYQGLGPDAGNTPAIWNTLVNGDITNGKGTLEDITGLQGIGRWIRVLIVALNNPNRGATIDEFEVYGTAATPGATFLGTDTTTLGNWKGTYGSLGSVVVGDPSPNGQQYPNYYLQHSTIGTTTQVSSTKSTNPLALLSAASGSTSGIAGYWSTTTTMDITLKIFGNPLQVGLYFWDFDTSGQRSEQIQILNSSTGAVLDTETISNFATGEYLLWKLSGYVTIQITNLSGSPSAILNGLFFDPTQP